MALKVGDYVEYDSGDNGKILCKVLYDASSQYGLQLISNKNVKEITINSTENWETSKIVYNNLIIDLNNEAESYINDKYAYDARCVGSIPTVKNGMFIDKDKGSQNTVTLPSSYTKPTNWENKDTGCYDYDEHYTTDKNAMEEAGLYTQTEEGYFYLASRFCGDASTYYRFSVRGIYLNGNVAYDTLCRVEKAGSVSGRNVTEGFRPCISLKSSNIKITGGDGKTEATAYTLGV